MLPTRLTHYAPWDDDGFARCGVLTTEADHSLTPTCPVCAASLAAWEDVELMTEDDVMVPLLCVRKARVA
jgi:hypothetical protein